MDDLSKIIVGLTAPAPQVVIHKTAKAKKKTPWSIERVLNCKKCNGARCRSCLSGITAKDATDEDREKMGWRPRPKPAVVAPVPVTPDGPSPIPPLVAIDAKYPEALRDMMHVHENVPEHDQNERHKNLRAWIDKEPRTFTQHMHRLQAEWEAQEAEKERAGDVEDMGTVKALKLVNKLLDDIKAKVAGAS